VSRRAQTVHVGGRAFTFSEGETIHTENSYKYGPGEVEALATPAGLRRVQEWTDPAGWFGVLYFEAAPEV
jgi:uncharacterized SAM-dependent methyltransferase